MADKNKQKIEKNDNFIVRLYKNIFSPKEDEIGKINDQVDEIIRNAIPSMNRSGEDRAFTDALTKYMTNGINPQYSFSDKKGKMNSSQLSNIFKSFDNGSADISQKKELYNTYRYLTKNIPQLDAAIDVIVENIIAPDEVFKEVLRIVPSNLNYIKDSESKNSSTRIEAMDINNIINITRIEEKLFPWLSNCLLTGNTYVEIIDTRQVTSMYLSENTSFTSALNEFQPNNDEYLRKLKEEETKNQQVAFHKLGVTNDNHFVFKKLSENEKAIKIPEKQFIENVLNENIFEVDLDGHSLKAITESYKNTKEFNISSISNKDFRDIVFNKKFDSPQDFEPKNKRGRPTNKDIENKLEKTGNENYKATLGDLILKQYESENVIKIMNSGFLLGYLVVKEQEMSKNVQNKIFGTIGNVMDLTADSNKNSTDKLSSLIIDKILDKYKNEFQSKGIQKQDIDNVDVRRMIASIIMEKKTANIRFVPPSYMIEFINYSKYGEREYGSSVLDPCLFLAKYYIALLTSYTVFNITRAPEKRVFKVEHAVDTNVKQGIENVIQQVKQKEIAFKDFHKQDAVPKELTMFDDIFLPTVDGQAAVSIEGFPGQSSNIDTSYLDEIRRMIINATKVPPSLLGDTENSYHTSASQENYKFSRTILRYQQQFQTQLTAAISKIYYLISGGQVIKLNKIAFNAPAFTKVEQIATMVGQADAICNFVVDSYGINKITQQPNLPKKLVAKEFAKFIDWERVDDLLMKYTLNQIRNNEFDKLQNPDKTIDEEVQDMPLQPQA